jgi:GNAT superfamily N-acetyltransferase
MSLGASVTLRLLGSADVNALEALYAAMDIGDARFRFFGPMPKHLRELAASTALADHSHRAIGAFLGGALVGVANYIRLDDPRTAEVAVLVAHEQQLHGIGTALLSRLVERARADGIVTLFAEVMVENSRMMQIIVEMPWPIVHVQRDGEVAQFAIRIDGPAPEGAGVGEQQ